MWSIRENQNGSSELYHYGIKGMRWGIRRTPEQLGHRPSKSQRKARKRLPKDVAAAQRYAKLRTRMNDQNQKEANEADKEYKKALGKVTLPWNQSKKEAAVAAADKRVQESREKLQETKWKMDRALGIDTEKQRALENYVDALTEKYGKENVKQLKTKYKTVGENFALRTIRTGPRTENMPILGNYITAEKIAKWEKEIRDDLGEKQSKGKQVSRYA